MSAFQVPLLYAGSEHFPRSLLKFYSNGNLVHSFTYEDLLMMVAHTKLQQYAATAIRARLRRCLERCCRKDLLYLIRKLGGDSGRWTQLQLPDLPQDNIIAAFAACEFVGEEMASSLTAQQVQQLLVTVDELASGTYTFPAVLDIDYYQIYYFDQLRWDFWDFSDWDDYEANGTHGPPWASNSMDSSYCRAVAEFPSPAQRVGLQYQKPRPPTSHSKRSCTARGASRRALCRVDIELC